MHWLSDGISLGWLDRPYFANFWLVDRQLCARKHSIEKAFEECSSDAECPHLLVLVWRGKIKVWLLDGCFLGLGIQDQVQTIFMSPACLVPELLSNIPHRFDFNHYFARWLIWPSGPCADRYPRALTDSVVTQFLDGGPTYKIVTETRLLREESLEVGTDGIKLV